MENLIKRIAEIQSTLKAPKSQYNKFGKYKYRKAEDILMALKPLLGGLVQTISDEVVLIGERFYIKATVTVTDGKHSVFVDAFAREANEKRGMDAAQISGATSSYARKYALNGMWGIDDSVDSDSMPPYETKVKKAISLTKEDKERLLIKISYAKNEAELKKLSEFIGEDEKEIYETKLQSLK